LKRDGEHEGTELLDEADDQSAEDRPRDARHAPENDTCKKDDHKRFSEEGVEWPVGGHQAAACRSYCYADRKGEGIHKMEVDAHVGTLFRTVARSPDG